MHTVENSYACHKHANWRQLLKNNLLKVIIAKKNLKSSENRQS